MVLPVLCLAGSTLLAQSDPATATEVDRGRDTSERLEEMKEAAASYVVSRLRNGSVPLTLIEEPVLRYSDNVTQVPDGSLYVWTSADRPEAVVCIWYHPDGRRYHEFQSLSESGLQAEAAGVVWWNPEEAGVEFREFPEAGSPAENERQRLLQMRSLARRFSAAVSDDKYGRQELRLLAQPVYRYGGPDRPVLDGAIFAFAKGTNPESLLLIEARRKEAGGYEWRYAPARMSSRRCEMQYDGKSVWDLPQTRWQRSFETYRNRVIR